MKFPKGSIIKFICNGIEIPGDFQSNVPGAKIDNATVTLKENRGVLLDYYPDYDRYLIEYIDKKNNIVRLGFKEKDFIITATPNINIVELNKEYIAYDQVLHK